MLQVLNTLQNHSTILVLGHYWTVY